MNTIGKRMRLFISIDFPEAILNKLYSWLPDLKGWKRTKKDKLHVTLAFLGECSEAEKQRIHSTLSGIQFSGFSLSISGVGAFPNEKKPRIIWAGVSKNDELVELYETISQSLSEYLNSRKSNDFIPHITLARRKSRKEIYHLPGNLYDIQQDTLIAEVHDFNLKKSILKPEGSAHKIIHTYPAGSG